MNVKNKLMEIENVHNVVFRGDGSLEIFSKGHVKNEVLSFLNMNCLDMCFIRIDFYNVEKW